ncbi:MAG: phosphoserine phosphatase [Pseudomonadota bacterium]|nr:phosphoserine phosphatase [Pseudomonadota bacterium]MDQ5906893.1 phosphoserine phosphatase [Pseudomonadota bacterium]MDQ5915672.1 phosphoserine phosphatase [Pseudomonadota bacterium]MDQ5946954.1 phosphoserine phosphatase [Pseudomonadota bacterium]MDQ5960224.1 phosphoserine phosphatase [Pseudomonadota bacterium]
MDLVIQGGALPTFLLDRCAAATGATAVLPQPPQVVRLSDATRTAEFDDEIASLLYAEKLDWCFVESGRKLSDFGLIAFDMDSTLITIECIDELADFAGKKAEVSAVTESAMRGEIDYRESLRRRLALLAGLDARVMARVFGERLLLSPGARELLAAAQNAGLRTAILSGGFTYFTERLRIELGFDFSTSNELEISGGKLTGRVVGDIVDAQAKAHHLVRLRDELGLRKEQVIAVGDGANDLMMMAEAGVSVAFHAKPATRAKASVALNFVGLDGVLNLFS